MDPAAVKSGSYRVRRGPGTGQGAARLPETGRKMATRTRPHTVISRETAEMGTTGPTADSNGDGSSSSYRQQRITLARSTPTADMSGLKADSPQQTNRVGYWEPPGERPY